jgi:hypothetical protein
MMDKKGGMMDMPINLLMLFIVVTFFVALLPGMVQMINGAQAVTSLNCHGYRAYADDGSIDWPNSANDTRAEASSIGCIAIKLYVPYIALGVLVGIVMLVLYGKSQDLGQQQQMY